MGLRQPPRAAWFWVAVIAGAAAAVIALAVRPATPAGAAFPEAHAAAAASAATAPESPEALPLLLIPVVGVRSGDLRDTFDEGRPDHRHEAIDIAAPLGAPVVAAVEGRLAKLYTSVPGGLTAYEFDLFGRYAYYYAHLDRYADGVVEGMPLKRGQLIGYVGTSGNAPKNAPHLHFAIFRLGPERHWWKGVAVNPFTALRDGETVLAPVMPNLRSPGTER